MSSKGIWHNAPTLDNRVALNAHPEAGKRHTDRPVYSTVKRLMMRPALVPISMMYGPGAKFPTLIR